MGTPVFWGTYDEVLSGHHRAEGAALKEGHNFVFRTMLKRMNLAGFDLKERWHHAKAIENIMRRDILFFTFVEDLCKDSRLAETSLEDGGLEGICVIELMLASARNFPVGPGPTGLVLQQRCKAEHSRVFGIGV